MSLFVRLGDHLPRQEENYLTQCLAALFEGSIAFRHQFWAELAPKVGLARNLSVENMDVITQLAPSTGGERSILDMFITIGDRHLVAIEVKFASGVSVAQLRRHLRNISRQRHCKLVLLVANSDVELPASVSSRVTVLTWGDICRCVAAVVGDHRRDKAERWLAEEFMKLLGTKHVVAAEPVRDKDWKRIGRIVNLWAGLERTYVGTLASGLAALASVVSRLEWHRDHAWGELRSAGWNAFTQLYRYEEAKKSDKKRDVSILVGFRKRSNAGGRRKGVRKVSVAFELQLYSNNSQVLVPRLSMYTYVRLNEKAKGDQRRLEVKGLRRKAWSGEATRKVFSLEWDKAHEKLSSWMGKGLDAFHRCRGYKYAR
ncbi:MAG: PD-(D/E)XK nuclease family protein [Phycisphaerae bacterium]|nr:PD-(D/E)XK nuclease family protein [Phycisphaerae bacterium]